MAFIKAKIMTIKGAAQMGGMILTVVGICSALFSGLYWNQSSAQGNELKENKEGDIRQGLQINTLETNYVNLDKKIDEKFKETNEKIDQLVKKLDNK